MTNKTRSNEKSKKYARNQTTDITLGKSTQKTSQSLAHDTFVPCSELSQAKDEAIQPDHLPKKLQRSALEGRCIPRPPILAFIVRIARNSQCAFLPFGVPSAVQVRKVIVPSGPPVASTPR